MIKSGIIKNLLQSRRRELFILLLLIVYWFLDFHHILFYPPQGLHFIRQTDSLAFVRHYLRNGMNFWEPGVLNLLSNDGRAASEFPVLYYLTACLYKVFGEHEYFLRLINLLIVSFGFFSLFRLLCLLFEDVYFAIIFTFIFFSSTILIYYANNYLPDAAALGFALAGWYYSWSYLLNRKKTGMLLEGFILFTLSSLIKVTYFINPAAFLLALLVSGYHPGNRVIGAIRDNLWPLIYGFSSVLLVLAWNLYAIHYNSINLDHYFLLGTRPLWSLDRKGISTVFDYISNYWYSRYYYQSTLHIFAALFVVGIILFRNTNKELRNAAAFLLAGSVCYFLLFFEQFQNHDYYFLALIPAIVFIITASMQALLKRYPRISGNLAIRLVLLLLCVLSINYAREKLLNRYKDKDEMYASVGVKLAGLKDYMHEQGIPEEEKVVILTDRSPNGGLYTINMTGWNVNDTNSTQLQYIDRYIEQGAGLLIMTDTAYTRSPLIKKYLGEVKGEFHGVRLYKIRHNP